MANMAALVYGQLAMRQGMITAEQLQKAVDLQGKYIAAGFSKKIGKIMREKKYLTAEQHKRILRHQELAVLDEEDMKYGRLAVRNGFISQAVLDKALRSQREQRGRRNPKPLGRILLMNRHLTFHQHVALLKLQSRCQSSPVAVIRLCRAMKEERGLLAE